MNLVTLRQFAQEKKITYEAVRKQVVKYADELGDHIVTMDGVKYLDDFAQTFLSERRRMSPIVVKIEESQADNDEYQAQIDALKTQLLQAQQKVIQLQDEARAGIEDKIKYQLLIEDHEEQKKRLRDAETALSERERELQHEKETSQALQRQNEETARQLAEAKKEAESYERSWFGFYRKKV